MQRVITTPLGPVTLTCENALLSRLEFWPRGECDRGVAANESEASIAPADAEIIQHASQQLHEYFSGQRTLFTLPLDARGTEFQQLAWRQLQIIIPCHRVIGANGTLTGYSGGLAIKQFLLSCERFFGAAAGPSSSDR